MPQPGFQAGAAISCCRDTPFLQMPPHSPRRLRLSPIDADAADISSSVIRRFFHANTFHLHHPIAPWRSARWRSSMLLSRALSFRAYLSSSLFFTSRPMSLVARSCPSSSALRPQAALHFAWFVFLQLYSDRAGFLPGEAG